MNVFPDVDERTAKWLTKRKEAGRKIEPRTAEVNWKHAQSFGPYGVYPELPHRVSADSAALLCALTGIENLGVLRGPSGKGLRRAVEAARALIGLSVAM